VFQRFNLFPHLTALQNIIEGPVQVLREPAADATKRALALLERVGLADKRDAYPSQLSGGQQQRVAIARSLAMRPELLLLDEPTSAMDNALEARMVRDLKDVLADRTLIVATHRAPLLGLVDRIIWMEGGRIVADGPKAEVLKKLSQSAA